MRNTFRSLPEMTGSDDGNRRRTMTETNVNRRREPMTETGQKPRTKTEKNLLTSRTN